MKLLITGGSGFIGTNLVQFYLDRGHSVLNIDIARPKNAKHFSNWLNIDIRDAARLSEAICDYCPDVVIHMAARTDLFGRSLSDYDSNTIGLSNVINAIKLINSVRLVIFTSSMLVCRIGYLPKHEHDYLPSTAYGKSKAEGERCVRLEAGKSFPWVIIRPTSIWGPWFDSPYRDFFMAIKNGWYFHPYKKRIRRSYGFVLNTVYQIDQLVEKQGGELLGKTVYIADYIPLELKSWADEISKHVRKKVAKEVPLWVFQFLAKTGDLFKLLGWKNVPMSSFRLNNLLTETVHDISPVEKICGALPYSMSEGVVITCDWLNGFANKEE